MSDFDNADTASEEPEAEGALGSQAEPDAAEGAFDAEGAPGEPDAKGAHGAPDDPEQHVELSALEVVTAERDQHLAALQRVTAEFANFRKQTEKRNQETVRLAAGRLMQALLPILDACDAALAQQVVGVEPLAAQLKSVLETEGLEIIDQIEAFDPNRHEAAISEPADDDQDDPQEPMVVEVLRTGYGFNGRVLRAAMVRVKG